MTRLGDSRVVVRLMSWITVIIEAKTVVILVQGLDFNVRYWV